MRENVTVGTVQGYTKDGLEWSELILTTFDIWSSSKLKFFNFRANYLWNIPRTKHNKKAKKGIGTSLVVQWLELRTSNARGAGSTPGRATKIPHATRCGQNQTNNKYQFRVTIHPNNTQGGQKQTKSINSVLLYILISLPRTFKALLKGDLFWHVILLWIRTN